MNNCYRKYNEFRSIHVYIVFVLYAHVNLLTTQNSVHVNCYILLPKSQDGISIVKNMCEYHPDSLV